jgi:hypothetical protein
MFLYSRTRLCAIIITSLDGNLHSDLSIDVRASIKKTSRHKSRQAAGVVLALGKWRVEFGENGKLV